jgi:hypothetical protein
MLPKLYKEPTPNIIRLDKKIKTILKQSKILLEIFNDS